MSYWRRKWSRRYSLLGYGIGTMEKKMEAVFFVEKKAAMLQPSLPLQNHPTGLKPGHTLLGKRPRCEVSNFRV